MTIEGLTRPQGNIIKGRLIIKVFKCSKLKYQFQFRLTALILFIGKKRLHAGQCSLIYYYYNIKIIYVKTCFYIINKMNE